MINKVILIAFVFLGIGISANAQKPIHLNEETFKEKVFNYETNKEWKFEGNKPVIVDFYADWCGPCKRVAPTLEELAKEYEGKIIIYKVNTDKNPNVSRAFGISGIPAFLFVPKNGTPSMATGALPKETFVKAINEVLKVSPK
ncbi:MAG: thioredoxin [Bacteroidetes bacterium]|nr:MAG: thioredoxin [Bacteroidota bacterium]